MTINAAQCNAAELFRLMRTGRRPVETFQFIADLSAIRGERTQEMFKNYLERIVHAISDNDQDALIVIEIDAWHTFYNDKIVYKELCLIRNLIAYAIQVK